ncbi:hypothetical protein BV22DRAFT_629879 [Leucogyrophana mollusca]|uniref:Uncharacterized protein n=1 Tax=Leucogyrophana mollusca TaxID=85980 RepID=A0ACB8BDE3_9AGAM|nr:hypothetical protein BV22DRAFT_629879 [Leucogyrophana mollusca]
MSETTFAQNWGPTFIGFTFSLGMYGVALGQYGFYLRAFPFDQKALRMLVLLIFIMDSLQSYGMIVYFRTLFTLCHRNTAPACLSVLPWELFMAVVLSYVVTFIVQSFYAHRVWIISGRNKLITVAVLTTTLAQFVLGMMCAGKAIRTRSVSALYTSMLTGGAAAGLSAFCDTLITGSVFFYLNRRRTGVKRVATSIQQLVDVIVNMGLFTCLVSLVMFVCYSIQKDTYLVGAPGPTLCKSYVNSMLAVLNARKSIRDHAAETYKLSTIPLSATDTPSLD